MARIIIDQWGTKKYYNDRNDLHREDGPAKIDQNGVSEWYRNGLYEGRLLLNGMRVMKDHPSNHIVHNSPNGFRRSFKQGTPQWPTF